MGFVNHPGPMLPFGRRLLRAANSTPERTLDEARARAALYPASQHVHLQPVNGAAPHRTARAMTTKE